MFNMTVRALLVLVLIICVAVYIGQLERNNSNNPKDFELRAEEVRIKSIIRTADSSDPHGVVTTLDLKRNVDFELCRLTHDDFADQQSILLQHVMDPIWMCHHRHRVHRITADCNSSSPHMKTTCWAELSEITCPMTDASASTWMNRREANSLVFTDANGTAKTACHPDHPVPVQTDKRQLTHIDELRALWTVMCARMPWKPDIGFQMCSMTMNYILPVGSTIPCHRLERFANATWAEIMEQHVLWHSLMWRLFDFRFHHEENTWSARTMEAIQKERLSRS
jgi:hypothetical protein